MRFLKKLLLSIFCFLIVFVSFGFVLKTNVNAISNGIGTINDTYSRTILKDMTYIYTDSNNGDPQKNYVLTYNPATSGVRALAMFGEYEFGGDTISTNVRLAESRGYTVIAGVNASPFDTSNGVTVGTIISNGKIISCNNGRSGYDSFAIRSDGTMFIGRSDLSLSFTTADNKTIKINSINKQKKTENNNVYLFTDDFATDTKTLASSCEVVLTYVSGDLSLGKNLVCKVEKINQNVTRTPIEKGKFVLTGPNLAGLGYINEGEEIIFDFKSNDTTYDWNDVTDSICGFYQILDDGKVMSAIDGDSVVHPRTTIGFKENGEIVLYVVDGRQPNFSIGLSDRACAEYMASLGCVDAIRMDGGGSSAMTIRFPGDETITTVNSPSDGQERHDSDCLLLVLSEDHDSTVGDDYLLHAYPNSIKLLQNTVTNITVKATDTKYNPKPVPQYSMEVSGDVGKILDDGSFQARSGEGTGSIKITGGNAETTVKISVTDKVNELYASVNNLALGPNEEYTLSVKAYYNNELLIASNEAFTWSCDDGLGTINEKGVFTSSTEAGKSGYIHVSYGSVSARVLVTVGQLPVEITGFENDLAGDGAGQWRNNQVNEGSGSCSINTDLAYVRYGYKSLRVDFNLAGTTRTCGTQISNGSRLNITGSPTAIGMWVYATPSAYGAWIRMQYSEAGSSAAKYADFGHIDWEGWKYLEADFEAGINYPVSVQYVLRIMGVTETERIDGTIYIDQIRAIYGFKNDDFDLPTIDNIQPSSFYSDLTSQTISFDVKDTGVGINSEAIELSLDGKKLDNLLLKEIPDGYTVSWTPSALQSLSQGHHVFVARCEDHAGNFRIETFDMFIGGGFLELSNDYNDVSFVNKPSVIKIDSNLTDFTKMELNISFDPELVEITDIVAADGITLQRKVINKSKQLIIIKLANDGYTGDGKGIISFTLTPLKTGDINMEYVLAECSRSIYGDAVLAMGVDAIQIKAVEAIDYSAFCNAVNKINFEVSGKELLSEYANMKEAYDILLSYESSEYMDDETMVCVSKFFVILLDYSSYLTKVSNAVSKVIGN